MQVTPDRISHNGVMTDANADAEPVGVTSESRVSVRRAPKYPRFIILGAGFAAIATFIATAIFEVDPLVGFGALFGYFALITVPIGALFGGLVAIVLDAIASKRAKQFTAERTSVDAVPDEVEGDLEN